MAHISHYELSLNINGAIAATPNWAWNLYSAVKFIRYIVCIFAVKIDVNSS